MAKALGDSGMAETFETISQSHQTVARRVAHMDEHVRSRLCNVIEKKKVIIFLCVWIIVLIKLV
jgi:t-SNARE complex subunit (syntaxin)